MMNDVFINEVFRVAYDEVERLYGIDLRKPLPDDVILGHNILMALIQATTASALICYHNDLRDRLLKQGIDIGPPMDDPSDE